MSRRWPFVSLLCAACLLAVNLPRVAAEGTKKLVTCTYPVADLVIPLDGTECCGGDVDAPWGGGSKALEDRLMKLITTTVQPHSWSELGGAGCVDYFPLGMALVVTQTEDVQAQVADLLSSLRSLQDVQVAVEMRLLTVSENFFERVGVDLGFFKKKGDKDGVALLNDVQVHQFLEAAQGDPRTNVLSAPKIVTMNGQQAVVLINEKHHCVTGIEAKKVEDQVHICPKKEEVTTGLQVALQPVVSADRRFVRIKVKAEMNKLDPTEVAVKQVHYEVKSLDEAGSNEDSVCFTLDVQKPQVHRLTVEKTLCLADGCTAVIGGYKIPVGTPNEFCPPVLSKVPYVNRLFKNVTCEKEGYLLVLVTPRIVIQQEEEVRPPATACTRSQPITTTPCLPPAAAAAPTVTDNLRKLELAEEYFRLAEACRAAGKCEVARRYYEQVQRLCPGSPSAKLAQERQEVGTVTGQWAEEQELLPMPMKVLTEQQEKAAQKKTARLAKMLDNYENACREGLRDEARKYAIKALAIDPTCFQMQNYSRDPNERTDQFLNNSEDLRQIENEVKRIFYFDRPVPSKTKDCRPVDAKK